MTSNANPPDSNPDASFNSVSNTKPVLVSVADGIATVTLNRPERRNAWTVGMQAGYFGALADLAADRSVRVIVVTGAGGSFCPGADTQALSVYSETGTTNPLAAEIVQPEWFPSTILKPLIAAIEGPCAGVGLAQCLLADIRIAAPTARFSTAFARRGLPAMHGGEWLLDRVAGSAVAHELLLTGRTFDGTEAERLGVVTEIADDPLARALEIAADIAVNCSPASLAQIKGQLWASRNHTFAQAIEHVDGILDGFLASAEFTEGINSFLQHRTPRFSGIDATSPDSSRRTS